MSIARFQLSSRSKRCHDASFHCQPFWEGRPRSPTPGRLRLGGGATVFSGGGTTTPRVIRGEAILVYSLVPLATVDALGALKSDR